MKSQTLALAEYFNAGNEVDRESAWLEFGIQNLTARLSELTNMGFAIVKDIMKIHLNGRTIRVATWKFRDSLEVGDTVQVAEDVGTQVSLKGRLGRVDRVDLHNAQACVYLPDVGFRNLKFYALKRMHMLSPGTRVSLAPGPYVILDYHPETDSYSIQSPSVDHTLVAHAALLRSATC